MPLPDDYIAVLDALAGACEHYRQITGGSRAVLVGGAAAAIYTDGLFMSGDFDFVAARDEALKAALLRAGFVAEDRQGHLTRASIILTIPNMVSSRYLGRYSKADQIVTAWS